MGSRKDLTGQRFGKLIVLSPTDKRMDSGSVVWKCKCDCGKFAEVSSRQMIWGKVRSCGWLSSPPCKDYIGMRFGRLTVLEYAGTARQLGKIGTPNFWKCRCDCGNKAVVSQTELQSGGTKSCGCLSKPPLQDYVGKRFGKLVVQKYAGKWDGLHRWLCICDCGNETVVGQADLKSGHTKSCGCRQKKVYMENLKIIDGTSVALLEAARRQRLISTNSSGYNGVYQNRKHGKWVAQITFKGKTYYLGAFTEIKDAAKARKVAEEHMYGEFLEWYYANHPAKTTEPVSQ